MSCINGRIFNGACPGGPMGGPQVALGNFGGPIAQPPGAQAVAFPGQPNLQGGPRHHHHHHHHHNGGQFAAQFGGGIG